MEISQLEQFRAIAECGTMRAAAEKMYLSQPTLSYNLKRLETELGCKLFVRAHNRLVLSPYGEILFERSGAIVEGMDAMAAAIEREKVREAATLHVGCFSLLASGFLMPQVAATFPETDFDVVNCEDDDLAVGLADGRFDVLIATSGLKDSRFKWVPLFEERVHVSAPVESPMAALDCMRAADLASCAFSIEEGLSGYSAWYESVLTQAGVADGAIERLPFKEYLQRKDALPMCSLITTFIMNFVRVNAARAVVPVAEPYARREIGLCYLAGAPERVTDFARRVRNDAGRLFGGNAFVPYFLFPEDVPNLRISND